MNMDLWARTKSRAERVSRTRFWNNYFPGPSSLPLVNGLHMLLWNIFAWIGPLGAKDQTNEQKWRDQIITKMCLPVAFSSRTPRHTNGHYFRVSHLQMLNIIAQAQIYTLFWARTLFLFRGQNISMLKYWLPPVKRRIVIKVCQRCLFTDDLAWGCLINTKRVIRKCVNYNDVAPF